MSKPKSAQVNPASGATPARQNTTGLVIPQTACAPAGASCNKPGIVRRALEDYVDNSFPNQKSMELGDKIRAAEKAGDWTTYSKLVREHAGLLVGGGAKSRGGKGKAGKGFRVLEQAKCWPVIRNVVLLCGSTEQH